MMREIKYRGLVIEPLASGEKWISSDEEYHEVYINRAEETAYINGHEVVYESVSEYTGIKDKNGREIFEGDIVRIYSGRIKGSVKFQNAMFDVIEEGGNTSYLAEQDDDIEVIGNIYENPELLEGVAE